MDQNVLWSLRLGFTNKEASKITQKGLASFLENSFMSPVDSSIPSFLENSPKTKEELQQQRELYKNAAREQKQEKQKKERQTSEEMKIWWIDKMTVSEFPLREKMGGRARRRRGPRAVAGPPGRGPRAPGKCLDPRP